MHSQRLRHNARHDQIINDPVDHGGGNDDHQHVRKWLHTERSRGLEVGHECHNDPGDRRTDIRQEFCQSGQESNPNRVSDAEQGQHKNIQDGGHRKNKDLSAQE